MPLGRLEPDPQLRPRRVPTPQAARTCLRVSALPLHLFAFPSSQPVRRVHPLLMAVPLVVILSSATNTPSPSPWQGSRCERHLSFPFSYFFAPISLHHVLFFNFFFPPPRPAACP